MAAPAEMANGKRGAAEEEDGAAVAEGPAKRVRTSLAEQSREAVYRAVVPGLVPGRQIRAITCVREVPVASSLPLNNARQVTLCLRQCQMR